MSQEEAVAEYERSEKGLRYQLIEGQIAKEHDIKITYDELKALAKEMVTAQFMQYGQQHLSDEMLQPVIENVLANQEETQRLSEQLMSQKLLDFYKENLKYKKKDISYKEFVEASYK